MNHARLIGFLKKGHGNPAKGIPLFKQESDGWEPWPYDVRAEFEKVATPRARLVCELCLGTGQRIGDVLKIRWNHMRDGAWDFTHGKSDKPMWIPCTDHLSAYLAAVDKMGLTVITDKARLSVQYRSVAEEMRKVKAKMQHLVASRYKTHGPRKNATLGVYQSGCDDEMVKAVVGHSGVEMQKKWRSVPPAGAGNESAGRAKTL